VPNLRDIQRRIVSVQKTQQITRAMRMVAAAKLRRAEEAITLARPYAERMKNTLAEVTAAQSDVEHPLLEVREEVKNVEVVVITSDRGLAGAFNSGVLRSAEALIAKESVGLESLSITCLGRKATEYFRRHRASQVQATHELAGWITYGRAVEIAKPLAARFEAGETDRVVIVNNEFLSTMTQRPAAMQLLPFTSDELGGEGGEEAPLPYSIEPSPEALFAKLVPKAVEVAVFRALLENQAGEHAARMSAMESATRNTEELIEKLTLQYNRARQAAITTELVEIVTGAESL